MKNKTKEKDPDKKKESRSEKKLEKKLEKKKKAEEKKLEKLEITEDRFLRLHADFENFKKRVIREKSEIYQRSNESLMEELLPVLDHMDLALAATDHLPEGDSFVEGVKLVVEQMSTVLGKFGLQPIDAEAQTFDPNIHEAVSHIPSDEFDENIVITQLRRGYKLGKLLLRPTQVVVSSGAVPTSEEE